MAYASYSVIHKSKIENTIELAYRSESQQIKLLGFQEEYYVCEKRFPFSYILEFDVVWRLSKVDAVVRVGPWLSLLVYAIVAIHQEGYAYITSVRNRAKFVTIFEDGTILHTSMFDRWTQKSIPEKKYIYQIYVSLPMNLVWQHHQESVQKISEKGNSALSLVTVYDALRTETQIDDIQHHINSTVTLNNVADKGK